VRSAGESVSDQSISAHQNARAICILMAITGNLDVKGGNFNPIPDTMGVRPPSKRYIDSPFGRVVRKQLGGTPISSLRALRVN